MRTYHKALEEARTSDEVTLTKDQLRELLGEFSEFHVRVFTGATPMYKHLKGRLGGTIQDMGMYSNILGRVLTLLESIIPEKERLESSKSLAREYLHSAVRRFIEDMESRFNDIFSKEEKNYGMSYEDSCLNALVTFFHPKTTNPAMPE